jgi:lipoyl(octanoyl) transferase
MTRELQVRRLGLVEYEDGLALQKLFADARAQGLVPDTLLLLQHPRVITLGRGAREENLLGTREQLTARGYEIHDTDRGGDVTYHGPGQIVGYPILDLKPDRKDVRKYVASIEELMIRVARDYGIGAERSSGRIGIWTAFGKLGAIGVHLSHWITTHGFAFNVNTDLADFGAIVPCGISDAGVVSLQSLLGKKLPLVEVEERFIAHAAEVWESEVALVEAGLRTVSAAIVRGDEVLLMKRTPARGGFWQILTGRMEPHESPLQAVAREVYEETGFAPQIGELIDLDYVHSFAIGARQPPLVAQETAFALRVPPRSEPRLSEEHSEYRWAKLDEAMQLLPFPGLRRTARKALAL